jgi:hypothetical protein
VPVSRLAVSTVTMSRMSALVVSFSEEFNDARRYGLISTIY